MVSLPDVNHLGVAQLVETLSMGGAERLAVQIAAERARAGDDSYLYVLGDDGPLAAVVPPEVTIRRLDIGRASIRNPLAFLYSLFRGREILVAAMDSDRIDVVQTHLPGANFWGLLLQINGQATCVPTIHNNREFDYGDSDHTLRAWFRRSAYRLMMKRCPAVVAVSKLVMESMVEQLELKPDETATMVVVPNGVPLPDPIDEATRCDIRTRFDCPDHVPLLVAAGRHTEQKNFRVLIEAVALLKERGTDFRLVLAGEGELWADHTELIDRLDLADLVSMPGNVADLGQIMQEADLFILPSLWEGLPLVLLEAMAAECAVVGTRIAGIDEVLHDDTTGRIVEPDNAMALADAMGELMASPDDRQRLAANARALVESDYSFDRVGRDLGELYRRITEHD